MSDEEVTDKDRESLRSRLVCSACGRLPDDAVQTDCGCCKIYCKFCSKQLNTSAVCDTCGCKFGIVPSHLVRRMVGSIVEKCKFCSLKTSRSELIAHTRTCPKASLSCPSFDCKFSGSQIDYVSHLIGQHKSELLSNLDAIFPEAAAARKKRERQILRVQHRQGAISLFDQSRETVSNTGKNYCRGPLNGVRCQCCDGSCGPNNGCNCQRCMRADLRTFGIGRPGSLVNREGAVATVSEETGKFYCGRSNMDHDRRTNGFCGPNNGNNCHACRTLDVQICDRYADILADWRSRGWSLRVVGEISDSDD